MGGISYIIGVIVEGFFGHCMIPMGCGKSEVCWGQSNEHITLKGGSQSSHAELCNNSKEQSRVQKSPQWQIICE